MNGISKGPIGPIKGISGWPRPLRVGFLFALIAFAYLVVNASSQLIENPLPDRRFAVWEPFVWEASSNVVLIALLFPALWLYDRYHPERVGLPVFALIQAAFFIAVSLSHIAGMVALRKLAYWGIAGWRYEFSQGNIWLQLIYEARKDALSYMIFLFLFWMDARISTQNIPPSDTRIELRDRGRVFYVKPADIVRVEAAGNYVEVHTATRTHLVRDSLGGFARKLDESFVRIHRSRIVNRRYVASSEPTASGDLKLRLEDGQKVIASRRYKSALRL